MREIDFQARWDQSNSHLQQSGFSALAGSLFAPLKSLCRQFMMPAAEFPREMIEDINRLWFEKWEGTAATVRTPSRNLVQQLRLRAAYEPVVLNLTTPDGVPITGTLYRHRRSADIDIPTVLCCQPNGQIARDMGWDWLLKKGCASTQPFNVIVFDYRECGESSGNINVMNDLVVDAETAYQAARDALHISEQNLHFLGYSMGGAVSARLADIHPLSGRCANVKSFDTLDSVIKHSAMIDDVIELLPIPAILSTMSGLIRSILGPLVSWAGWGMDARRALERIKQRTLFMYHPQDPLIPEAAAAVNAAVLGPLQAANQVVKLQFKPTVRCECDEFNHHNAPLKLYQDEHGHNATKKIVNFLLGRDIFVQRRLDADRTRAVIHPSGEIEFTHRP